MLIGILAMQGDIEEHEQSLHAIGLESIRVKKPSDLQKIEGIIFPGGESTTMIRLLKYNRLDEALKEWIGKKKMPVYGSCAGMILLSEGVTNYPQQECLNLIGLQVERNAFGRQIDSFEADIEVKGLSGGLFTAIFIRAPLIRNANSFVEIIARYKGDIVMAKQENILVSSFHPELTQDSRIHLLFLSMVKEWQISRNLTAQS